MQTGYARKMVLAAILALTVATGVGAGSAASSEAPQVTIGTHGALGPVTSSEAAARRVVSLGYDRRCGREAFAFKTGKRQSIPAC